MLTLTLAAVSGGILWAILGIGFLIFIHEYGHYTACRLTKTRVETFSIGFGPRLFGWERPKGGKRRFTWGKRQLDPADHAMDFRVAVIPLGGYVKMAGENPGDVRSGSGDEFSSKSIPQRLLIVSAGVIMNAITAFVFYTVAFQGGMQAVPALVGSIEPGSAAWEAGMRVGDRVVEVNGHALTSFTDLRMEAAFLPRDEEGTLVVDREGRRESLKVKARYLAEAGVVHLGVGQPQVLVVGEGSDALRVGPRDAVTVDGVPAYGGHEAGDRIEAALASGRTTVEVKTADGRTGQVGIREAKPDEKPSGDPLWKIGIHASGPPVVEIARGAAGGLKSGDALVALRAGERRIEVDDTFARLALEVDRVDEFVVRRGETETAIPVPGVTDRAAVARLLGEIAFRPAGTVVAAVPAGHVYPSGRLIFVLPTSPAEGQVRKGDRIVSIDGTKVATFQDVSKQLNAHKSAKPLTLKLAAPDGGERDVSLTPVALELKGVVTYTQELHKEPLETGGVLDSIRLGAGRLWREVANTFRTIGAFFTGNISFDKNVAGPITLVTVSSEHSQRSFLDLLWFLAYVSVMLAVLNILPIPVLDGGHIVYLVAEKIRGRPLSDAVIGRMQLVGLLLLLTLMVFAIKNDIKLNF